MEHFSTPENAPQDKPVRTHAKKRKITPINVTEANNAPDATAQRIASNGHIAPAPEQTGHTQHGQDDEAQQQRKEQMRRDFLLTLFAGKEETPHRAWAYVWKMANPTATPGNGNGRVHGTSTWKQRAGGMMSAINAYTNDYNLYIGTTLCPEERSPSSRATAKLFTGLFGLFADIDVLDDAHSKKQLPPDRDSAHTLIDAIGLKPTMIVDSGHGYHVWWLFDYPWTWAANDATSRARAVHLLDRWRDHVKQVASGLGWEIDNVFDAARVLRIPGTINAKWRDATALPTAEVTLEVLNTTHRYAVPRLEAFLAIEPPRAADPEPDSRPRPDSGPEPASDTKNGTGGESDDVAIAAATAMLRAGDRWDRLAPFVGMLAYGGIAEANARAIVAAICDHGHIAEKEKHLDSVTRTYAKWHAGEAVWGGPELAARIGTGGEGIVKSLKMLFNLHGGSRENARQHGHDGQDTASQTFNWREYGETAAQLQQKPLVAKPQLIRRFLPMGLIALAGRPKAGKSVKSLQLAVASASDAGTMYGREVLHGTVLYIALEDTRMQTRLRQMLGPENTWPTRLHIYYRWRQFTEGGLADIDDFIVEHPDTVLVIIDTLPRFRGPQPKNAGYDADYGFSAALSDWVNHQSVARSLLGTIHTGKRSGKSDPDAPALDLVQNTSGMTAGMDSVLVMERRQGVMHLLRDSRDIEQADPLKLRIDPQTMTWVEDESQPDLSARDAVLEALQWIQEPLSLRALADFSDKTHDAIKHAIYRLLKEPAPLIGGTTKGGFYLTARGPTNRQPDPDTAAAADSDSHSTGKGK